MKLILLIALFTFTVLTMGADVHVGPQDKTATPAYTELTDGSWKISVAGIDTTLLPAEADQLADLIKPPPPPDSPPTFPGRPSTTFTRLNQGNGGTGFATSAGRSEIMVAQGWWRTDIIGQTNFANPAAKLLVYQNVSRAKTSAGASFITTAQAQAHGWDSGITDPDAGGHILKPVDAAGYSQFACDQFKRQATNSAMAGYPVDGAFWDDDNSSVDSGGQPASTWNPWMEDVNRLLSACLRAAGYLSVPNLSAAIGQHNLATGGWQERQIKYFPYIYAEFTAWWPDGSAQPQSYVNETFRLMGVAAGLGTVFVAGDSPSTEAKHAFSLGMCLVRAANFCSKGTGQGNTDQWYPAYDRAKALGPPLAPGAQVSPGVWERTFERGKVRVDVNARTAVIP